jgi:hypothetical protein
MWPVLGPKTQNCEHYSLGAETKWRYSLNLSPRYYALQGGRPNGWAGTYTVSSGQSLLSTSVLLEW